MEDRAYKIAMLHIEGSASKEEIAHILKLIGIIKGDSEDEKIPKIKNTDSFYEAAKILGLSKNDFPRIIMEILRSADTLSLPSGLVGDIGEFLGENGIKLIPGSLLPRTFLNEDLDKKIGANKWKFFFEDKDKFEKFKEQKGF